MVWDCCGSRVRNQLGLGRRLGKDEKDSKDAGTATTYWAWSWGAVFGYVSVKVGCRGGLPSVPLCVRENFMHCLLSENK